jgi:DNA-directed RNA polymerase subunit RPC12/RpoP
MYFKDYQCEKCELIFQGTKNRLADDWPKLKCPECGSENTYTLFNIGGIDIGEGKLGNASNGYTTGIAYHPSRYGKYKGTRIK